MKTLIGILLLAISWNACAAEIGFFVGSYHLQNVNNVSNEHNHGIFIRYKGFGIGGYKNSFSKNSFFVNGDLKLFKYLHLDYGLISGYGWDSSRNAYGNPKYFKEKILPFVSPRFTYAVKDININIHFLGDALGASLSTKF